MPDVLLHLWRGSWFFGTNNQHQMMDQTRASKTDQELFAPHDGTFGRFRMRIHRNDSTGLVQLDFLVNGVVLNTIEIDFIGQVGDFLPDLQLPIPFDKDDSIVMRISGISGSSIDAEFDADLSFTL